MGWLVLWMVLVAVVAGGLWACSLLPGPSRPLRFDDRPVPEDVWPSPLPRPILPAIEVDPWTRRQPRHRALEAQVRRDAELNRQLAGARALVADIEDQIRSRAGVRELVLEERSPGGDR